MEQNINDAIMHKEIKKFLQEIFFTDGVEIDENTLLFQEDYFDSIGFVSLVSFIEEKFHIQTNDNDLVEENFESINTIINFIKSKQLS